MSEIRFRIHTIDNQNQRENAPIENNHKTLTWHTDPELQVIVQGLEEGSPWFNKIFGVLFCDYDESQGLLG